MPCSVLGEISPNIGHRPKAATMESQNNTDPLLAPKGNLHFLQKCLKISNDWYKSSGDWVFMSVSIKNTNNLLNVSRNTYQGAYNFQISISILDLKHVPELSANDAVNGYNFVGTTRNYFEKAVQDFHFGQTQPADAWDAVQIFALMIATFHSHGHKLALVGHSLKPCMRILRGFGLDLTMSFLAYIDTYDIAHKVFECVGRPTFTDLLEALDIKFAWLNCAGNYANYVTKALLALATYE
ncbi:hypothetical protein DL98DRAFT_619846 [Cadophora sp. DSE1049]|nr:hypothetical protein DL98DRAFT_619846 [Cadophora sp. DSE1049]